MKKTLSSKITSWIRRGTALILALYFLVAFFAGIPFFGTSVGLQMIDDERTALPEEVASVSLNRVVGAPEYDTTMAFNLHFLGYSQYRYAAAPTIVYSHDGAHGSTTVLHTDNLVLGDGIIYGKCMSLLVPNTTIIGWRDPQYCLENGETGSSSGKYFPHFIRSYSSPMLPVINTGSAVWGMLLLTAIPILLSFVFARFCPQFTAAQQKAVLRSGSRIKLIAAVCLMAFFSATALFYLPEAKFHLSHPLVFPLLRWITPIFSIPALSVWIASFKNKSFAPLVAAGIMALCLYQPFANLICLFGSLIAWGYLAEGVRCFFARFKKVKAE